MEHTEDRKGVVQQCTCNACRLHGAQLPGRGENLEIRVLLYSTRVCEVTVTTPLLSCVDDRLRGSSPVDHCEHACIPWPFMRSQDSFLVSPSSRCLRSHGPGPKQLVGFMSVPRVHRGIRCPVPCFMLEAFPEKAQSSVVVPFDRMPASIRPRYISSKNRNSRTISTYIHPDFINDRWHTGSCPICSGTSGFRVFAIAHKAAGINTAITSRQQCVLHSSCKITMWANRPPIQFKGKNGGQIRQIKCRER